MKTSRHHIVKILKMVKTAGFPVYLESYFGPIENIEHDNTGTFITIKGKRLRLEECDGNLCFSVNPNS